jgi:photosystem II stability/assembly factor-like uncharacterized protein
MRLTSIRPLAGAAIVLALGAVGGLANAAPDVPDVQERAALQSARAASGALLAVARAGKRLVSVGERGIVLLSDDDGSTWRQAKVPVSVSLTNVRFVTEKKGWAVGHSGAVLHSTDGGENWVRQLGGAQVAALVLEAVRAKATRQGGEAARKELAEAERLVADGPDKPFLDVHFADENHGLVVGAYGLAFATQDGGKHWQPWSDRIPNPQGRHLYSIHTSGNTLFVAGEQGALFRSADAGSSFVSVKTPYQGTYFGAIGGANGELVVFGLRGNAYWSGDGGERWQKVESESPTSLTGGVRLADGTLVLVDQAGQVLQSRDGGRTFRRLAVPNPTPASGIAQAADGALILSGMRGVRRVAFNAAVGQGKP